MMPSSKTLEPNLMEKLCGLSSSCRRSHLDSASYRTLSRIFAVCHELSEKTQNHNPNATFSSVADEVETSDPAKFEKPKLDKKDEASQLVVEKIDSVGPQNPNPSATISSVADKDQTSDSRKSENPELDGPVETLQSVEEKIDSVEPQNPDSNATPSSVADEDQTSDSVKFENSELDGTVEALQLAVEKIDSVDEVEINVSNSDERLNSMVSDLSLLVSAPIDPIQSSLGEFAPDEPMSGEKDRKLNHEQDQNQQMEVDMISAHNIETRNDAALDLSCQEKASDEDFELSEEEKRLKCNPYNKTIDAELVKNMELSLEIREKIQLEPPNTMSNLGSSNQDQLNGLIKEGEITDEAQDLDDESDLDNKIEPLIDEESENCLVDTNFDEKLATKEVIPGAPTTSFIVLESPNVTDVIDLV